ncbi:MAG: hypothetical protein AMXMBFR23_21410 [Chloroflexota bacterium]
MAALRKWIIRLGVAGISRHGSGAPMASGRKKSLGLRSMRLSRRVLAARRPVYGDQGARAPRRRPLGRYPRGRSASTLGGGRREVAAKFPLRNGLPHTGFVKRGQLLAGMRSRVLEAE